MRWSAFDTIQSHGLCHAGNRPALAASAPHAGVFPGSSRGRVLPHIYGSSLSWGHTKVSTVPAAPFLQGQRRLELFGEDHNIRPGWVTVGKDLSSSNFNPQARWGSRPLCRQHVQCSVWGLRLKHARQVDRGLSGICSMCACSTVMACCWALCWAPPRSRDPPCMRRRMRLTLRTRTGGRTPAATGGRRRMRRTSWARPRR